ncbi:hypothetical protein RIF29_36992 [Crotalaria pallida]|uniref:Pentatricopeptide repeat protein n=1 Tax=Crotalaria pallida TaxID=3830 RepID=A0AAN9HW27_CROPI
MPRFAKLRFFSCSHTFKTLPLFSQQMGLASVADTLYTTLHKNNVNVETLLSKLNPKLDSRCVIQVLRRCHHKESELGVRFFIWAGFQSGYRHSAYMYREACNLLGIVRNPKIICDVIESYEAEGCLVTVNMFREALKMCKEAQLADMALWLLGRMEGFNLRPDTVMYNVVIRLCCKKGEIEMAEKLVKDMSLNGLYPDVITYMAMIEELCNVGRSEDAYALLKVMRVHGCMPNAVAFSAVLNGFCKSGSMERALELLDEMEKVGGNCSPNVVTYTSVIQSFCKRGQWTEAFDILDRMKAFGCQANHVTVFTFIESLCDAGRVEEASRLIDKFVVEHGVSYGECCSSLVISLIRIKRVEEAEKLFREMLAGEVKPMTLSCSLMLKELCKKDRVLDGFYLLDALEKMGYLSSIDSDIYSILLVGLCQKNHLMESTKLARIMLKKSVLLRAPYQDSDIDILSKYGEKDLVNQLTGIHKGLS